MPITPTKRILAFSLLLLTLSIPLKGLHELLEIHEEAVRCTATTEHHLHQAHDDCQICQWHFSNFISLPSNTVTLHVTQQEKAKPLLPFLYYEQVILSSLLRGPPVQLA